MSGSRSTAEPLISTVLRDAGFVGEASDQARLALETAKITRTGKTRIALEKVPRALELLSAQFAQYCGSTQCLGVVRVVKPEAEPVLVQSQHCEVCSGSDLRELSQRLAMGMDRRARVVVVGGSSRVREELRALRVPRLELRLVSGLDRRTLEQARADRHWADVVVVLGSSELKHKVSNLYRNRDGEDKLIVVPGRGVASALSAVETWLSRRKTARR